MLLTKSQVINLLPYLTLFATDGREIQFRRKIVGVAIEYTDWSLLNNGVFPFDDKNEYEYRIKPKPKMARLMQHTDGGNCIVYEDRFAHTEKCGHFKRWISVPFEIEE